MNRAGTSPRVTTGAVDRGGGEMRMRSMTWLWVLLAVYAFVVVAMFLAQRSLIYPAAAIAPRLADQALPAPRAIETEPEPGLRPTHRYHPTAGERQPLIVFFHGNGSDLAHAKSDEQRVGEDGVK